MQKSILKNLLAAGVAVLALALGTSAFAQGITTSGINGFVTDIHTSIPKQGVVDENSSLPAVLRAAVISWFAAAAQAQAGLQTFPQLLRPEVSSRPGGLVGSLPAERRMNLSFVLPLRNQAELSDLLNRLYDPASRGMFEDRGRRPPQPLLRRVSSSPEMWLSNPRV